MKYHYLIIGSGLYGATFANLAHAAGKSVLVIDKRPHIAGNVYTERVEGINVRKYGAHIFHTNNKTVWKLPQPIRRIQPLHEQSRRELQGRALLAALQYVYLQQNVGRNNSRRSRRKNRRAAQGGGNNESSEFGRTGNIPRRHGYLSKARQGLHRKTVGARLQRPALIHHKAPSRPPYFRQQLF